MSSPRSRRRASLHTGVVGTLVACIVVTGTLRTQIAAQTVAQAGWDDTTAAGEPDLASIPPQLECRAEQTGGFHDYPEEGEKYEPALFHPQAFTLEENVVFMMNLAAEPSGADLYLTMQVRLPDAPGGAETAQASVGAVSELECRQVRGANGDLGFSCVNRPPSEMLLINARTLRFTRTAVGGWTFAGATGEYSGDSIFVEYGQCRPMSGTGS